MNTLPHCRRFRVPSVRVSYCRYQRTAVSRPTTNPSGVSESRHCILNAFCFFSELSKVGNKLKAISQRTYFRYQRTAISRPTTNPSGLHDVRHCILNAFCFFSELSKLGSKFKTVSRSTSLCYWREFPSRVISGFRAVYFGSSLARKGVL